MQRKALRIISFSQFDAHSGPIFKKLKLLKLKDHITLENCLLVYDFLKNKLPNSFDNFFVTTNQIYSSQKYLRSVEKGLLFIPFANTTKYGLNSLQRKCISCWNHFTTQFNCNLQNISRLQLKNKITQYFLNSHWMTLKTR